MTDPYDEIPLPSVGVLTDAETIKQLREDVVRQYIAGMKELRDKLIRSQAENARLKEENTAMCSKVIQEEVTRLQAVTHAELARLRAIVEKGTE